MLSLPRTQVAPCPPFAFVSRYSTSFYLQLTITKTFSDATQTMQAHNLSTPPPDERSAQHQLWFSRSQFLSSYSKSVHCIPFDLFHTRQPRTQMPSVLPSFSQSLYSTFSSPNSNASHPHHNFKLSEFSKSLASSSRLAGHCPHLPIFKTKFSRPSSSRRRVLSSFVHDLLSFGQNYSQPSSGHHYAFPVSVHFLLYFHQLLARHLTNRLSFYFPFTAHSRVLFYFFWSPAFVCDQSP